jgi:hypothetical protein
MNQSRLYYIHTHTHTHTHTHKHTHTHTHTEVPHGKFLCGYLKQAKMSFLFSFTKLEKRRAEQAKGN